jgi:hypothetical protein
MHVLATILWIGVYVALFAVIVGKGLQEWLGKRRERKK